jgi:hypothetical protein
MKSTVNDTIELLGEGELTTDILEGIHEEFLGIIFAGASADAQAALLGKIAAETNTLKKNALSNKFNKGVAAKIQAQNTTGGRSSRADFIRLMNFFPGAYRIAIATGQLRIVDAEISQTKALLAGAGTIQLFTDSDVKSPGVGELKEGQLPANKPFVVSAVRLLTGVSPSGNVPTNASFGLAERAIMNGTSTFRIGGKEVFRDSNNSMFDNPVPVGTQVGRKELDNPMLCPPLTKLDYELAQTTAPLVANTWSKVVLIGSTTTNN